MLTAPPLTWQRSRTGATTCEWLERRLNHYRNRLGVVLAERGGNLMVNMYNDTPRFRDRILGNVHRIMDEVTEQWTAQDCRVLVALVDALTDDADLWACLLSQKPLED